MKYLILAVVLMTNISIAQALEVSNEDASTSVYPASQSKDMSNALEREDAIKASLDKKSNDEQKTESAEE